MQDSPRLRPERHILRKDLRNLWNAKESVNKRAKKRWGAAKKSRVEVLIPVAGAG